VLGGSAVLLPVGTRGRLIVALMHVVVHRVSCPTLASSRALAGLPLSQVFVFGVELVPGASLADKEVRLALPWRILVADSRAVHLDSPLAVVAPFLLRLPVELAVWAKSHAFSDAWSEGSIFALSLRQGLAHHLLLELLAPPLVPQPGRVLSGVGLRRVSVASGKRIVVLLPGAEVVRNQSHVVDRGWLRLELWVILHQASEHVGAVSPPLVDLLARSAPADVDLEARLVSVVAASHQGIRPREGLGPQDRLHRVEEGILRPQPGNPRLEAASLEASTWHHRALMPLGGRWSHRGGQGLLAIHEWRDVAAEGWLSAEAVVWLRSLVDHPALRLLSQGISLNTTLVGLIERLGRDFLGLVLPSHCLRLLQDSLEAVDQVLVVLVAVEHVEAGQYELVLLLNEPVEKLNVLLVSEVVVGKAAHELEQLLLVLWDGRHRSLHEGPELLCEPH